MKSNGVKCTRYGKVLCQNWHSKKMWRVRLCISGLKYSRSVHRMVCISFIENTEGLLEVNHKDGDRSNNNLTNLEWISGPDNIKHAVENGLINNPFGSKARHFKRSILVYKSGKFVVELFGNKEILDFGLCYKQVSACLLGKQKTHRSYTFKSNGDV